MPPIRLAAAGHGGARPVVLRLRDVQRFLRRGLRGLHLPLPRARQRQVAQTAADEVRKRQPACASQSGFAPAQRIGVLAHFQASFAQNLLRQHVVARTLAALEHRQAFQQQLPGRLRAAQAEEDGAGLHQAPGGEVRPAGGLHQGAGTLGPGQRAFVVVECAECDACVEGQRHRRVAQPRDQRGVVAALVGADGRANITAPPGQRGAGSFDIGGQAGLAERRGGVEHGAPMRLRVVGVGGGFDAGAPGGGNAFARGVSGTAVVLVRRAHGGVAVAPGLVAQRRVQQVGVAQPRFVCGSRKRRARSGQMRRGVAQSIEEPGRLGAHQLGPPPDRGREVGRQRVQQGQRLLGVSLPERPGSGQGVAVRDVVVGAEEVACHETIVACVRPVLQLPSAGSGRSPGSQGMPEGSPIVAPACAQRATTMSLVAPLMSFAALMPE